LHVYGKQQQAPTTQQFLCAIGNRLSGRPLMRWTGCIEEDLGRAAVLKFVNNQKTKKTLGVIAE